MAFDVFNKKDVKFRIEQANLFIHEDIKNNISLVCFSSVLFLVSLCLIYVTWFSFLTLLIFLFDVFAVVTIVGTVGDNIKNRKYIKLIHSDISVLEEVERIRQNKDVEGKEGIWKQADTNNGYSVILTSTYGCKIQVIKCLQEVLSLSMEEVTCLVDKVPAILIEYIDFERANQIKKELDAVGAECIIEEYTANNTEKNYARSFKA